MRLLEKFRKQVKILLMTLLNLKLFKKKLPVEEGGGDTDKLPEKAKLARSIVGVSLIKRANDQGVNFPIILSSIVVICACLYAIYAI